MMTMTTEKVTHYAFIHTYSRKRQHTGSKE